MPEKKGGEPRLKVISLVLKDALASAGVALPDDIAISTAGDIVDESNLFGWCLSSCKEGCKKTCKSGCSGGCSSGCKSGGK